MIRCDLCLCVYVFNHCWNCVGWITRVGHRKQTSKLGNWQQFSQNNVKVTLPETLAGELAVREFFFLPQHKLPQMLQL